MGWCSVRDVQFDSIAPRTAGRSLYAEAGYRRRTADKTIHVSPLTFNASLRTVYVHIVGYTAFPGAETYRAYWYVAPWVCCVRFLISSHYSI
jgi:hypothetical protein